MAIATKDIDTFVTENLEAFKLRMRITSEAEDDNLRRMLSSSAVAVILLVGATELEDLVMELIFERARYLYHDALDEFMSNYRSEIECLYLLNSLKEASADDETAETETAKDHKRGFE